MKQLQSILGRVIALGGLIGMGLALAGCQSEPQFADLTPHRPAAVKQNGADYTYQQPKSGKTDFFQVGDVVKISFTSVNADPPLLPHSEAIKDDGRITPPIVGSVVAAGKSPGALQAELQEMYDKYYKNLTVTVASEPRYYYVLDEVRSPGPKPYLGDTDIIKAISAAGGFTDFANKKHVKLIRGNKTQIVNVVKALDGDRRENVAVYPGDTISVPRRLF